MSRPTPEREAMLRATADYEMRELLAEIDALRQEKYPTVKSDSGVEIPMADAWALVAARVRELEAAPTVSGFVKFIEDERWHNFPVSLAEFKALAHRYVESLGPTRRDA